MRQTFVHIGLPKTGTTTLQNFFFSSHPALAYAGQTNVHTDHHVYDVLEAAIRTEKPWDRAHIESALNTICAGRERLVLSDEAFSFGEFMLRGKRWDLTTDHAAVAQRIFDIFGAVDIFVVVRDQADWLESWHKQGLKVGKYVETDFGRWLDHEMATSRAHLFDLLRYDALYAAYSKVFGAARVHLYFYEEYKDRFHELAMAMARVMDVDADQVRDMVQNRAANKTQENFHGLPRPIKRITQSAFVQRLKPWMGKSLQRKIRSLVAKDIAFQKPSAMHQQQIRAHFKPYNDALYQQLGKDRPSAQSAL